MIAKQLRRAEFTEPQIRELKLHRKFILICDGYDESQQTHNLYTSNRLNEPGEWQAKMVISCRSEYLGAEYKDRFQPGDRNHRSDASLFQEAVITPFSMDQVQEYIDQYVSVHQPLWGSKQYKDALDHIPSLKELVKNPFLMSLSLEVLPRMVDPEQDSSVARTTHITRVALYDQFIEHWLERGKKRLGEKNLSPQARAAFESLSDDGFTRSGISFLKKLCVEIYRKQGGQPIVQYSRYNDDESWKAAFFSREDEKQLLREACPLIRNGNQYRFIHRSLLEYGLSLAVFDPQVWKEKTAPESSLARRGSASSAFSFVIRDTVDEAPASVMDVGSPLVWRSFVNEPSVLLFLEERVRQEAVFKQQLLDYIEGSKSDKTWRTAAANAITILVRSGHHFNQANLRGIQIPGADLSYGLFDSAQLQGADLRQVDLRGVWMRQVDLSGAQMVGVQFGELPFLLQDGPVKKSVYSPDGTSIAITSGGNLINVYSTSTWERAWTLEGHHGDVEDIAYSPKKNQLASGSDDFSIRLWDIETGTCSHILHGHSSSIWNLTYSAQGDQIASCCYSTVKLWDAETGECRHTMSHSGRVCSLMYSPGGSQIVSGGYDGVVRLWNVETGECSHILLGHGRDHYHSLLAVAYSPRGDQFASAGYDKIVRLWDTTSGECRHILAGHTSAVICITYSPHVNHIASASWDATVKIWDIETGAIIHSLLGHGGGIVSVIYSPQGDLIASTGSDKTVRLWDAETGVCRQTLIGHSEGVTGSMFSPKGDQVASSSDDRTVRLWDVRVGSSRRVSNGHSTTVWRVKFSPCRNQVVSCSFDKTARVWDVGTGERRHILEGHSRVLYAVAYSPRGSQIATGSLDSTVRLWDSGTGACSHILTGHGNEVYSIAYSPQGDRLASTGYDKTVRLWDVRSGECCLILEGHTAFGGGVAFSPAGRQIASCGGDKTVRLWNVETGVCSHTLTGHGRVQEVVYSPQGDYVASAGDDRTLRVCEVPTGDCCRILIGRDGIESITFSPSGNLIAFADGKTVRLWDIVSGRCRVFTGHSGKVNRVVFSPQGDLIASASNDRMVRLWEVASGRCRAMFQDLPDCVLDIDWIYTSGVHLLVNGCNDGSVLVCELVEDGEEYQMRMRWSSMNNALVVTGTMIQDVQGLSQLNKQLLKQRGAVGEPVHRLREAGKKVASMAAVVSKLKYQSSRTAEDASPVVVVSEEQSEQQVEKANV